MGATLLVCRRDGLSNTLPFFYIQIGRRDSMEDQCPIRKAYSHLKENKAILNSLTPEQMKAVTMLMWEYDIQRSNHENEAKLAPLATKCDRGDIADVPWAFREFVRLVDNPWHGPQTVYSDWTNK